jgi:tetratricopeptide (TPR) repeat protein
MTRSTKSFTEKMRWQASKLGYSIEAVSDELLAEALQLHLQGCNDDAIALLGSVPPASRSARAWRILGHAELARGAPAAARECHEVALQMNLDARRNDLAAEDLVNLAAVHIDVGEFGEAWDAAEKAHDLVPEAWTPHVVKISVLNNRGDRDALARYLATLLQDRPELASDPDFRRHVEFDLDFIGIADLMKEKLK